MHFGKYRDVAECGVSPATEIMATHLSYYNIYLFFPILFFTDSIDTFLENLKNMACQKGIWG